MADQDDRGAQLPCAGEVSMTCADDDVEGAGRLVGQDDLGAQAGDGDADAVSCRRSVRGEVVGDFGFEPPPRSWTTQACAACLTGFRWSRMASMICSRHADDGVQRVHGALGDEGDPR
jgi:hypothetical protein